MRRLCYPSYLASYTIFYNFQHLCIRLSMFDCFINITIFEYFSPKLFFRVKTHFESERMFLSSVATIIHT